METNFLDCAVSAIRKVQKVFDCGRIHSVGCGVIRIRGFSKSVRVGDQICLIAKGALGEVLEVNETEAIATLNVSLTGVTVGMIIENHGAFALAPHMSWIGRVIDPAGRPLDGRPLLPGIHSAQIDVAPPDAYRRRALGTRLETRLAIFDTLLPLVRGQRIGLFAGSGVGKSTLLADLAKGVDADVIVLALVGERGREVKEFVSKTLGPDGMKRSIVIAATSDNAAQMRRRCAETAMSVAEYFRDQGLEVFLLVDSVTRFAEAHREICVSAGESTNLRGYPSSTGSVIARLCERAGPGIGTQGNITAVFNVLVAGSDMEEPIADMLRGVLDGHVVLSRDIAESGRFPAIDLLRSVSRSLPDAATDAENQLISETRKILGTYAKSELMIRAGLYSAGTDQNLDRAIKLQPDLERFLSLRSEGINAAFGELRKTLRQR